MKRSSRGARHWLLLLVVAAAVSACGVPADKLPYKERIIDAGTDSASAATCRAAPRSVLDGWPCGCTDDCGEGAFCNSESASGIPGGFCFRSCTPGGAPVCSAGAGCPDLGLGATSECIPACKTTADCPPHQYCDDGLCLGFCFADADCLSGHCNTFSGQCTAMPPPTTGAGVYAACVRHSDCRSNNCGSRGRCVTTCALSDGRCPDEAVCVNSTVDPMSDLGFCFPGCSGTRCTDSTLACSATGVPQDKTACFVPGTASTCLGLQPVANTDQLACGCSDDCSWGAGCLSEAMSGRPHGTCVRRCLPPDGTPCGTGYVCDPDLGSCVRSCNVDKDCVTPGRICDAWHECTPFCTTGADCASGGPCDPYSGRCRASPTTGAAMGAACTTDTGCKSGLCDPTQHFCFSRCRVSAGCPDTAVCVPADPSWANDYGFCFPRCTTDGECLQFTGARCRTTAGAPLGTPMHCE